MSRAGEADWAYYNSSTLNAGDDGRYGLGAGPTDRSCSSGGYSADQIVKGGPVCPHCKAGSHCRMYSPCKTRHATCTPDCCATSVANLKSFSISDPKLLCTCVANLKSIPVSDAIAGYLPAAPEVIKPQLLQLLAAGESVYPVPNTSYKVLWRKSMLHPGWSQGYGLTMVDFSSELFGLSTLWLGSDFCES